MPPEIKAYEEYRSKLSKEEQMLTDLCSLIDLFPKEMKKEVFYAALDFAKPNKHAKKRKQ